MAPTKNLRKNYRVKSKKRPIPKNNKRKTSKSKKRPSRNKRRTRRKQKGGNNTTVIVRKKNPRGLFRTGSRKSNKIEPELQQTASSSIPKLEKKPFDPQNFPGYFHIQQLSPQEIAGFISPRQAEDYFTRQGYSSSFFLMPHSPGGPIHYNHSKLLPAGQGATLSRQ